MDPNQDPTAPTPDNPQGTPQSEQQGNPQQQQAPASEALQQQLEQARRETEEARKQAEQFQENYRNLQADHTRKSQALAQLVTGQYPQQQPVDPVSRIAAELKAKGYKEEDIRPVLEANRQITQELIQQHLGPVTQQLQATQAYTRVGEAMQQAASNPQVAQLLSDPEIGGYVNRVLAASAQQGVPPDPQTAANLAFMAFGQRQLQAAAQPPQQQAPVAPPPVYGVPQFPGTTFAGSGFVTRPVNAPVQKPLSPGAQALDAEIKKSLGQTK